MRFQFGKALSGAFRKKGLAEGCRVWAAFLCKGMFTEKVHCKNLLSIFLHKRHLLPERRASDVREWPLI